jgi:radical SAM superfamily enzyme YgiQ (UPF0313 family)
LVKELQSHGIRVLGSSIIGLEEHTPENIDEAIEYAVAHDSDFHQFMLYTPLPGTGLHKEMNEKQVLVGEADCGLPEVHGQYKFNFLHPHIRDGQETEMLLKAFRRDFEANGPSIVRMIRTMVTGWKRYKNHPDARVRARFVWEAKTLVVDHMSVVSASARYFKGNKVLGPKIEALRREMVKEFGLKSRLASVVGGLYVTAKMRAEMKRLAKGQTWEPPTFYEHNFDVSQLSPKRKHKGTACRFVTPRGRDQQSWQRTHPRS